MTLIGLLVGLIIVCLLWWAVTRLLAAFGVGDPIATVVKVIFVILVIVWLLSAFGYGPGLRLR
jgi:hypothetical protein